MNAPVRLLIHGASGRMGQALLRLAAGRSDVEVVAAVSRSGLPATTSPVPWHEGSHVADAAAFDVAIDFSLPEAFDGILSLCRERGAGFVSGTTGLSETQRIALQDAAADIPTVWAANFSLGVAVIADLAERAARALADWDCDIVEAHHVHKKDAPSGTALALGERIEAGGASPRYSSLRAGDIVGEHLIQFAGEGERIEIVHRATNRDIFARGALHVARRLHGRAPRRYAVHDLLG